METLLKLTFPIVSKPPKIITTQSTRPLRVSMKPPPPDFDFRSEILQESKAAISKTCPELLDLVDSGGLVLIEKRQFGPVPAWRSQFVEPEAIWLVGTTHISDKSAAEVERVVRAVKPDNVVVELCRSRQVCFRKTLLIDETNRFQLVKGVLFHEISIIAELINRAGIMYASEEGEPGQELRSSMFSLTGNGFFDAVGRSISLGGQTALALRLLFALFSSKISSDTSRPFGDEFRAARKLSAEVGAQMVLGDRPIEITLERAWNSLKWREKLTLVVSLVRGILSSSDISRGNSQESSTDADNFQLYEQLSYSYPSLLQPLIHERDTYLAWSLKRSKAVNNSKRVVGVIGKGHMNGVIYALISDQGNLRFRDLVGQRPASADGSSSRLGDLLKSLIRDTLIGIVIWELYEQIKPSLQLTGLQYLIPF
ncbi:hypothetical protein K2173_026653 [Erythroxylum novogranatense]|uniref:TraB domain-containing protein n=1 Tax=Erythroxylum novogranatense TaxID=1862640 RepID=A0AAV8TWU6_9ROSI|nr:hypothetical protein K2173_026653 [Erythroxylum novogranatense]